MRVSPANPCPSREAPMDALRVRLGSLVEWAIAAMFLTATFAVGSLVIGELSARRIHPSAPAARTVVAATPSAVPAGAVSVPVLPFSDGKEIRVGDTAAAVATRLGRAAESGRQEVDRGTPRRAADPLLRVRRDSGSSSCTSRSSATAIHASRRFTCPSAIRGIRFAFGSRIRFRDPGSGPGSIWLSPRAPPRPGSRPPSAADASEGCCAR